MISILPFSFFFLAIVVLIFGLLGKELNTIEYIMTAIGLSIFGILSILISIYDKLDTYINKNSKP
jgi:hypothetical protein